MSPSTHLDPLRELQRVVGRVTLAVGCKHKYCNAGATSRRIGPSGLYKPFGRERVEVDCTAPEAVPLRIVHYLLAKPFCSSRLAAVIHGECWQRGHGAGRRWRGRLGHRRGDWRFSAVVICAVTTVPPAVHDAQHAQQREAAQRQYRSVHRMEQPHEPLRMKVVMTRVHG